MQQDNCGTLFRHLLEIVSRLRDDCSGRIYFQIAPENARLLEMDADHFGPEVGKAFGDAVEDIAEAASCLALERPTACVFHLMRALEVAATLVADKIGAAVSDEHGRGLAWGVIAANMKAKIDKMPKGSDEQTRWYRAQSLLETVNRAWRTPTAHPKKTYTPAEARRVFEATGAFMQGVGPFGLRGVDCRVESLPALPQRKGAEDQGEDAGECGAGAPLYDDDLAFQGFDFASDRGQLGIDVVEPALVVRHGLGRSLRLVLRSPAARSAS